MLRSERLAICAVCATCLISCGSESTVTTASSDAATSSGGAPSGGAGSGGASGTPATDGGTASGGSNAGDGSTSLDLSPPDAACRTGTDQSACISCCDANHSGAYLVQAEQTRACACVSPGICANICSASYCVSKPQTAGTCYDCVFSMLGPGEECFQVAIDACGSDSACTAYVKCRANCVQ